MDKDRVKENIKRFISNKNTITFFLVIVLIVIIYVIYLGMIKSAVDATNIPYAASLLKAGAVIESNDVQIIKVAGAFVTSSGESLIQTRGRIVNYQVAEGYQIPKNSFFYNDAVVEKNTTVNDDFYGIHDGYAVYALPVDFHSTYGNSIMPGNYIDIYFSTSDQGKTIFEQFITSIPVYRVYDAQHQDVFSNADDEDEAKPKFLYFELRDDIYELLMVCEKIGNIELVPVPRNANYSENPQEMKITNEAVVEYIDAHRYQVANN